MCKIHKKPLYITLTFETKVLRLERFVKVNLMSGARKVPVKQRGGWPKGFSNYEVFWLECCFLCDLFVETQAGGLFMAARGSAARRREKRMRSWWKHEQASVRMAMIIAGHNSYRKAAGIEIGVQAGTRLFHTFDRVGRH